MEPCRTNTQRDKQSQRDEAAETTKIALTLLSTTAIASVVLTIGTAVYLYHVKNNQWTAIAMPLMKNSSWILMMILMLQVVASIWATWSSSFTTIEYNEPSSIMIGMIILCVLAWFISIKYTLEVHDIKPIDALISKDTSEQMYMLQGFPIPQQDNTAQRIRFKTELQYRDATFYTLLYYAVLAIMNGSLATLSIMERQKVTSQECAS